MADRLESPAGNQSRMTTITDLNEDSLAHCGTYLSLQDVSNLAMTCKYLRQVAYSDSMWLHFLRQCRFPPFFSETLGAREAYLARHTALMRFKFGNPLITDLYTDARPCNHIILDKNQVFFSQGSDVRIMKLDDLKGEGSSLLTLSDHNARITCMRLFPLNETSLFRTEMQRSENFLVTSSCDHSIRLWWKGSCQRCFRGHSGPVSAVSDKLIGDGSGKLLASGGEDGTVRLWSLGSSGKRGQRALKATLYGHEKPIKLMSVAGHKTSLLVTVARDSKVRVWDATKSSAVRSSCCVGMTSVPGAPVNMKCHESLLYLAAGSSVVTIDLRSMQKVATLATNQPLHSFETIPSKFLLCTGGNCRAMLWDIRKSQEEPISELDGHTGPVTLLHMDSYKVITGGPEDSHVNVWTSDTGVLTNSLAANEQATGFGCSGLAANGYRVVTASHGENIGFLRFRDFTDAFLSAHESERDCSFKFWEPLAYDYSDTYSEED